VRALVTGGEGFIGSHLCDALRERGHYALSYDLAQGLDVLDAERLQAHVNGADVVFDCAGILGSAETFGHIEATIDANIKGTIAVLRACQAASVPMVYLSLKTTWHNPYCITKRAANEFCLAWHEYYGLPVCVVRGLNVYGPRQKWGKVQKAVPTFIVNAIRGLPLDVYGDGQQITDQIHVSDLCEVLIRAWEKRAWGAVIDAGTGIPTTVNALAQTIVELAGSNSEIRQQPMRPGEPPRGGVQLADPTAMVQRLGYYPRVTLREGMVATIDWYREHYREVEKR
jgi:UDP-glucose 4-epimerase